MCTSSESGGAQTQIRRRYRADDSVGGVVDALKHPSDLAADDVRFAGAIEQRLGESWRVDLRLPMIASGGSACIRDSNCFCSLRPHTKCVSVSRIIMALEVGTPTAIGSCRCSRWRPLARTRSPPLSGTRSCG